MNTDFRHVSSHRVEIGQHWELAMEERNRDMIIKYCSISNIQIQSQASRFAFWVKAFACKVYLHAQTIQVLPDVQVK